MQIFHGIYEYRGLSLRWRATSNLEILDARLGIHGAVPVGQGQRTEFSEGFSVAYLPNPEATELEMGNITFLFPSDLEDVPPKGMVWEFTRDEWLKKELDERRQVMAQRFLDVSQEYEIWGKAVDRQRAEKNAELENGAKYANVIVGLGYGAFFALWAGLGGKVPKTELLLSATVMSISLTLFVSYEILAMATKALVAWDIAGWFSGPKDRESQIAREENSVKLSDLTRVITARLWPIFFAATVATGLYAVCTLGVACFWAYVHSLPK